eukprot:2391055-Rhodomonas_salina.2
MGTAKRGSKRNAAADDNLGKRSRGEQPDTQNDKQRGKRRKTEVDDTDQNIDGEAGANQGSKRAREEPASRQNSNALDHVALPTIDSRCSH